MRTSLPSIKVSAVFLALAWIVAACSGPTATPTEISPELILAVEGGPITSDDGSLTLEIPPGALAEDTEIRVSRVAEGDLNRDDIPEIAKYILEPSGTVFSEPVELTLVLPISLLESGFRVLNVATEVPADPAQNTVVDVEIDDLLISDDGSEATLVMGISHFSRLSVLESGFFKTSLSVPGSAVVGVPFTATAITRSTGPESRVLSRWVVTAGDFTTVVTRTVRRGSSWDLTGAFPSSANLSPSSLENAPPKTLVSSGTFTSPATFTCRVAGTDFELAFRANISFEETLEATFSPNLFNVTEDYSEDRVADVILIAEASGECVGPPTPTPGGPNPTPTPTLTPPNPVGQLSELFFAGSVSVLEEGDNPRKTSSGEVAVTQDGKHAVVLNTNTETGKEGSTLFVIETTPKIIGTLSLVRYGRYPLLIGDGRGLVVDQSDLVFFTLEPFEITGRLALGQLPRGVVVVGNTAYIALGVVRVLDLNTREFSEMQGTVPFSDIASLTAVGDKLVVVEGVPGMITTEPKRVTIFDRNSLEVLTSVLVDGPESVAASPDGQHILITKHRSNTVTVLDVDDGSVVATIVVGNDTGGIAVVGTRAVVANTEDGTVSLLDLETWEVIETIDVGPNPYWVSAVGGIVLVSVNDFEGRAEFVVLRLQ